MRFPRRLTALLRPVVEKYDDPDFGPLRRVDGGDWSGEVPFRHPPTGATLLSLLIGAGEARPEEAQRIFFREFLRRYTELWPRVADALAGHHPKHKSAEAVAKHVDQPCLCLDPLASGQPRCWSLQYTFDYPNEGDMGYFVDFREWEIVDISAAD